MSSSRCQVLILLGTYTPGYKAGGPIRSIENLVAALGEEFNFRIVTLDRDLGDKSPFPNVAANRWVRVGHADVMYLRPGLRGSVDVYALLRSVDRETVLFLTSFFARSFSMLAVLMCRLNLCRPRCLVLAPHGEFSTGALQIKRTRKRLYIVISRWLGLYRGLIWRASSRFEAADICRQFPRAKDIEGGGVIPGSEASGRKTWTGYVATATDFASVAAPVPRERRPKMRGQLRLVFVSRLARMKNLSGALSVLKGISGDVSFDIYGPAEDAEYWEECQGLIAALPANIRVRYWGEIEHDKTEQVFAEHDLFLFPTLGEAFGHVIPEAFLAGCPVLTSDQTPWRGLETLGVGWDLPLAQPERYREVLQQCVDMRPEEHGAMSARAAAFGAERARDPAVIEQNRALFRLAFAMPLPE